jgi:hypothetical protein
MAPWSHETSSAPFLAEQRIEILSFWNKMNVEGNSYPRSHVYRVKECEWRRQDERKREDLKCCSLSDGFILSCGKEYAISIGYRAILVVFASFLIHARQLPQQGR